MERENEDNISNDMEYDIYFKLDIIDFNLYSSDAIEDDRVIYIMFKGIYGRQIKFSLSLIKLINYRRRNMFISIK